jgi:hypothetical protein
VWLNEVGDGATARRLDHAESTTNVFQIRRVAPAGLLGLALLGLGTTLAFGELSPAGPATPEAVLVPDGGASPASAVAGDSVLVAPADPVTRTDIAVTSISGDGRDAVTSPAAPQPVARPSAADPPTLPTATSASASQTVRLSVAAGPFTAALGPGTELLVLQPSGTGSATAILPALTVVNALGDGMPWSSTGVVDDFHAASATPCPAVDCIRGIQLGWAPSATSGAGPGSVVVAGATTVAGSSPLGAAGAPLCSAPEGFGGGTFACGATLTLAVPPGTAAGDYTTVLSLTTVAGATVGTDAVVLTTRVGTAGLPVVPQGGDVDFSGGGFGTGTPVAITLHSTPVLLTTTTADAGGRFAVVVTVPRDTPPGLHRLVATGVDPAGRPHAVTMSVSVVPVGTPVGPSGPPSTTPPTTAPTAVDAPEVLGTQERPGASPAAVTPVADTSPGPTEPTTTTTTRPPVGGGLGQQADGPGPLERDDGGGGGSVVARWWFLLAATAVGLGLVLVRWRRAPR